MNPPLYETPSMVFIPSSENLPSKPLTQNPYSRRIVLIIRSVCHKYGVVLLSLSVVCLRERSTQEMDKYTSR